MELIVGGKNVLEPVNLDKNKNEIMQQRASVPSQVSLTHFKENVGFFKANVKGEDVNELVAELQKTFSAINTRETKMYDQLDTVFKTVESIHKGSIEGIIVGVKSAQEAISQAEYAIEAISETLAVLQDFKNQLEENTEHLNDIDIIWDATQQLDSDVKGLEKSLMEKAKKIDENIKILMALKSMLDKIKHIKDIDTMYKDASDFRQKFDQEKKTTTSRFDSIAEEIRQLEKFKASVEKIEHLRDVDTIYEGLAELRDNVAEDKRHLNEDISVIQVNEKRLVEFKQELEEIEHLKDIDTIWETNNKLTYSVEELKKAIKHNSDEIDNILNELHKYDALEKEVIQLKGKMKRLYYALGGTVGVMILHIILNTIGIL